jgi:hypothetical protein
MARGKYRLSPSQASEVKLTNGSNDMIDRCFDEFHDNGIAIRNRSDARIYSRFELFIEFKREIRKRKSYLIDLFSATWLRAVVFLIKQREKNHRARRP